MKVEERREVSEWGDDRCGIENEDPPTVVGITYTIPKNLQSTP